MTTEDKELLDAYTATKSDEAFGVLVERYAGMVYHAALRQAGSTHKAEEITQDVFIALARQAPRISRSALLSGWFFRATRYETLNHQRAETRRQRREEESSAMQSTHEPHEIDVIWEQVSPELNEALDRLPTKDREALLIRFFEGKSHKDVAKALGMSEGAAKKKVVRAVEKLRLLFVKRGIIVPSVGLVAALTAHTAKAAPPGLIPSIKAMALAKASASGVSSAVTAKGITKLVAWMKLKTTMAAVSCVMLVIGTAAFVGGETPGSQGTEAAFLKTFAWDKEPGFVIRFTQEMQTDVGPEGEPYHRILNYEMVKGPEGFVMVHSGLPLEMGYQRGGLLFGRGLISNMVWDLNTQLHYRTTNAPNAAWADPATYVTSDPGRSAAQVLDFGIPTEGPVTWAGDTFHAKSRALGERIINGVLVQNTEEIEGELVVSNGLPSVLNAKWSDGTEQVRYTYESKLELPFPSTIECKRYHGAHPTGTTTYRILEVRRAVTGDDLALCDPQYFLQAGKAWTNSASAAQLKDLAKRLDTLNTGRRMAGQPRTAARPVDIIVYSNGVVATANFAGQNWTLYDNQLEGKAKVENERMVQALREQIKSRQSAKTTANEIQINLRGFATAKMTGSLPKVPGMVDDNLAEVPTGSHIFGGVPFNVEGVVQLPGKDMEEYNLPESKEITIGHKFKKLHLLHGASNYPGPRMTNAVANLTIHYADGSQEEFAINGGAQLLELEGAPLPRGLSELADNSELAWMGNNAYLKRVKPDESLHLYRTTFENPKPDEEVTSIEYTSTMTQAAPFMLGLTVE